MTEKHFIIDIEYINELACNIAENVPEAYYGKFVKELGEYLKCAMVDNDDGDYSTEDDLSSDSGSDLAKTYGAQASKIISSVDNNKSNLDNELMDQTNEKMKTDLYSSLIKDKDTLEFPLYAKDSIKKINPLFRVFSAIRYLIFGNINND